MEHFLRFRSTFTVGKVNSKSVFLSPLYTKTKWFTAYISAFTRLYTFRSICLYFITTIHFLLLCIIVTCAKNVIFFSPFHFFFFSFSCIWCGVCTSSCFMSSDWAKTSNNDFLFISIQNITALFTSFLHIFFFCVLFFSLHLHKKK